MFDVQWCSASILCLQNRILPWTVNRRIECWSWKLTLVINLHPWFFTVCVCVQSVELHLFMFFFSGLKVKRSGVISGYGLVRKVWIHPWWTCICICLLKTMMLLMVKVFKKNNAAEAWKKLFFFYLLFEEMIAVVVGAYCLSLS